MKNTIKALLILVMTFPCYTWAGEKPWIEVRSEHFRVISNGEPLTVYAVAREFEQIRAVFAIGSVNMRLDSGTPLLIFAPRDLETMGRISSWPDWWRATSVGGYFHPGREKSFAVVRLDVDQPGYFQPVYHEYVHSILHMNFRWLPLWLDEGLSELYGTSRFTNTSAIVGAPTPRKDMLQHHEWISLKELFAADMSSPLYHGPRTQLFYAESWALAHYLTFGEGMDRGKRLGQFYNLLQSGMDQEKAFEQAFGPIKETEDKLDDYARKGKMHAWEIKPFAQIPSRTLSLRTLTPAEAEAELGGLSLWVSRDFANARELLNRAVKDDPKLALAHENMGFLHFADGKDEEALHEFNAALDCDPTRYLSLFFSTMLSPITHSSAPADEAQLENNLFKIMQLNPQFAPVFVQLSLLYAKEGDAKKSLAAANKAAQLEPSRAGYGLLAGHLLLQTGQGKSAASIAKYVADRWHGPDHDEAIELWNKIPEQQRPAEAPTIDKLAADLKEIEGTVSSVRCEDQPGQKNQNKKNDRGREAQKRNLTLLLRSGGQILAFHMNSTGSSKWGYSDVLWYGEDHFTPCHHLEGMRAIVRFKPSSTTDYAGDFTEVQLRTEPPVLLPYPEPRAAN